MGDPTRHAIFMIFALSLVWESESYNLANVLGTTDNITLARFKRQIPSEACFGDSSKFQCANLADCVDVDVKCDGKEDCPDGSDETEEKCKDFPCYDYLFRCDYGACISPMERCDGQKNCRDNSDEKGCNNKNIVTNNNCRSDQFECQNGECIELDRKCNGIGECSDKSDETEALCLNIFCPGYTYKCKYGACVDGDSECNGVKDCIDNSDEDEKKCGPQTPPPDIPGPGQMCETPKQPSHGSWVYPGNQIAGTPNKKVPSSTTIVFSCKKNYKLSTTNEDELSVTCGSNGKWKISKLPECEQLCAPIYNKDHYTVSCKNKEGSVVPCDKATDYTVMTFKCEPYFEKAPGLEASIFCLGGSWENTPKCVQVCGEKRVTAEPLIVNGHEVERGNYPWMVALYSSKDSDPDYDNICGGSLLATNVVLTAAHCVTYKETGKPIRKNVFRVAAGKYYHDFDDTRDSDTAQFSEIERIVVHEDYKGEVQNFRDDIALLKLKTNLALSKVVQPVCFKDLEGLPALQPNDLGLVTGWGFTETTGKPSETLKEVNLPYVDNQQCAGQLERDFADKYLTSDKICAGLLNKNTSVCKGDSGGALVFKHTNKKYYVRGIVSLSESFAKNQQIHCNVQRSALFTKVEKYYRWIRLTVLNWSNEV